MLRVLALLALHAAPSPRVPTVGLFDLSLAGIEPSYKVTAIDALASAVAQSGMRVVSRSDIEALLGADKIKQTLGCDDVSCLAEVGMAAGVERIIAGSLARVEGGLVVTLQLVNVQYASVEHRVTLTWEGSMQKLTDVLGAAAEELVLAPKQRKPGAVRVFGVPASAAVFIDGTARGMGAVEVKDVAPGLHKLRIEAPGFQTHQTPFVVRVGQTQQLEVLLAEAASSPIYARWWFWTGAAALVGGAVAVTWVITHPPSGITLQVPPTPLGNGR